MRPFTQTAVALLAALAMTACAEQSPTAADPVLAPSASASSHNAHADADIGTTAGWFDGKAVTFFYNKPFFCKGEPTGGASSGCVLGAEPSARPRGGNIPVVYVMTPLGFEPEGLHCPTVGQCINHPSTIDASRVFGAGAENLPLPAHSHIVDQRTSGWWEIEVIGVTDPQVWNSIAAAKDLATVRTLHEAGSGITGDIPTNLFLFFGVRP